MATAQTLTPTHAGSPLITTNRPQGDIPVPTATEVSKALETEFQGEQEPKDTLAFLEKIVRFLLAKFRTCNVVGHTKDAEGKYKENFSESTHLYEYGFGAYVFKEGTLTLLGDGEWTLPTTSPLNVFRFGGGGGSLVVGGKFKIHEKKTVTFERRT